MKKRNTPDTVDNITAQWELCGLKTDINAMQIAARVLRMSKALEARIAVLHRRFNLRQGEFDVLAALKREGQAALTPSELYQSMLLSSGAMTSRLDRLEDKGLISRSHCTRDRRSVKVSLTAKGKALIDQAAPAHFDLLSSLLADMGMHDKMQLSQLLKVGLNQLESHAAVTE